MAKPTIERTLRYDVENFDAWRNGIILQGNDGDEEYEIMLRPVLNVTSKRRVHIVVRNKGGKREGIFVPLEDLKTAVDYLTEFWDEL